MTPTLDQINKDLAEFMGFKWLEQNSIDRYLVYKDTGDYYGDCDLYTESLDSLIPVWEKLANSLYDHVFYKYAENDWCFMFRNSGENFNCSRSKTIQEAAAIATWKAVKELEK